MKKRTNGLYSGALALLAVGTGSLECAGDEGFFDRLKNGLQEVAKVPKAVVVKVGEGVEGVTEQLEDASRRDARDRIQAAPPVATQEGLSPVGRYSYVQSSPSAASYVERSPRVQSGTSATTGEEELRRRYAELYRLREKRVLGEVYRELDSPVPPDYGRVETIGSGIPAPAPPKQDSRDQWVRQNQVNLEPQVWPEVLDASEPRPMKDTGLAGAEAEGHGEVVAETSEVEESKSLEELEQEPASPPSKDTGAVVAKKAEGREGFVWSPFEKEERLVDVSGIPSGTLVKDPYSGKTFKVP